MEPLLMPEQSDGLLRKAQSGATTVKAESEKVSPFDLRQSKQLSAVQTRRVTALHEAYARRIESALSSFLRMGLEIKLAAVEQISYGEFLEGVPELTYLASPSIPSLESCAILQTDLSVVFSMVDLILGGSGKDPIQDRDLTEIEEEVFEPVTQIFCSELKHAWLPVLELDLQFGQRQPTVRAANLLPASERILLLRFEVNLTEAQGKLNLALPTALSTVLLRKLMVQPSSPEPANSHVNEIRLQDRLLDSRFQVELMLPSSMVSVRALYELELGSVLVIGPRTNEPILLTVAGEHMFLASPVRCGSQRGAQIQKTVSIIPEQGKDTK